MTRCNRLQRWTACCVLAAVLSVALSGCSAVPRRYTWIAQPGVTLTMLTTHPDSYVGKVLIWGGTITVVEENDQHLFLRLKNRPVDQDYKPHRPVDPYGPEAGSYWVMVEKQQLHPNFRDWGRVTVVGRVTGEQRFKTEPVLLLLYMRGWNTSGERSVWENINPQYVPSVPVGVH